MAKSRLTEVLNREPIQHTELLVCCEHLCQFSIPNYFRSIDCLSVGGLIQTLNIIFLSILLINRTSLLTQKTSILQYFKSYLLRVDFKSKTHCRASFPSFSIAFHAHLVRIFPKQKSFTHIPFILPKESLGDCKKDKRVVIFHFQCEFFFGCENGRPRFLRSLARVSEGV